MTTITDESLIEQLRDERLRDNAFRSLLKKYGDRLYWHIRRIVVVKEDAEDAMQETAIKVYRSIGSFKGDSSLSTWMYRIATNEALQIIRRRKANWSL
jgi:RNA polymerase sigma factor, sigma-70 family